MFDTTDDFSVSTAPGADDATVVTVTFRRDAEAADLIYRLQASENLTGWTTIVESNAGGDPTGMNGATVLSEDGLINSVNLVNVEFTLPSGSNLRQFLRLQVERP